MGRSTDYDVRSSIDMLPTNKEVIFDESPVILSRTFIGSAYTNMDSEAQSGVAIENS